MHCPDDWYRTFFHGLALDLWRAFTTPEYTRAEADAIVRLLGVEPPARVLDVPCGNGRLALELAARGFRTAGVDVAADSIAEGQAEAKRRGLDVPLRQGDMRRLDDLGPFDAACARAKTPKLRSASTRQPWGSRGSRRRARASSLTASGPYIGPYSGRRAMPVASSWATSRCSTG